MGCVVSGGGLWFVLDFLVLFDKDLAERDIGKVEVV
jgi:hypothetical protein